MIKQVDNFWNLNNYNVQSRFQSQKQLKHDLLNKPLETLLLSRMGSAHAALNGF